MKKEYALTLRKIITIWTKDILVDLRVKDFLVKLLPDVFNASLTPHNIYRRYHGFSQMSESAMNNFLRGNRRSDNHKSYAVSGLTDDIKSVLLNIQEITYSDGKEPISAKESMIQNIWNINNQYHIKFDRNHSLFNDLDISVHAVYDPKLSNQLELLLNHGSQRSLCYCLFLMILVSIYQDHICDFKEYYRQDIIQNEMTKTLFDDGLDVFKNINLTNKNYQYFTNRKYMHTYRAFTHHAIYNKIFPVGEVTMQHTSDNKAQLTLILKTDPDWAASGNQNLSVKYVGTPILNTSDSTVFCIMTNNDGRFGILCFRYDHFNVSDMFCRTCLFISTFPNPRTPQVKKLILCSKDVDEASLPYIDGLLKLNLQSVTITDSQLQMFLEDFKDAHWMTQFKESILPFILQHEHKAYTFNENEILNYSLTNMTHEDKIRVIQALKSKSIHPTKVDCRDLENLHLLFLHGFNTNNSKM